MSWNNDDGIKNLLLKYFILLTSKYTHFDSFRRACRWFLFCGAVCIRSLHLKAIKRTMWQKLCSDHKLRHVLKSSRRSRLLRMMTMLALKAKWFDKSSDFKVKKNLSGMFAIEFHEIFKVRLKSLINSAKTILHSKLCSNWLLSTPLPLKKNICCSSVWSKALDSINNQRCSGYNVDSFSSLTSLENYTIFS